MKKRYTNQLLLLRRKWIWLVLSAPLVVGVIVFFSFFLSKDAVVVLSEQGYQPREVTVAVGESVTFRTELNENFWPASNNHPNHTIYSDFDPKRALNPQEEWSFTFTRPGVWRYHDHINPGYEGTIVVTGKGFEESSYADPDDCKALTGPELSKCFEDVIYARLDQQGISAAFNTLSDLYATEPEFQADCHGIAHEIGRRAYSKFTNKEDFELSDKSSYCGYGFYHGFMETLLVTTGDVEEARAFCDYAEQKLRRVTADAGGACYHGIGHGLVEDEPLPDAYGNPQKVIDPGIELCEFVSDTKDRLFRCVTGVFNAYEILGSKRLYGLSHDLSDPFAICRSQEEKYHEACYTQLSVVAMQAGGGDIKRSLSFTDSIEDDLIAIPTMQAIAIEMARSIEYDYASATDICKSLSPRFQIPCITAYGEGFLKYGPPQTEYVKAVGYCSFEGLTEEEREACYERVLSLLRIWYTTEKSEEICRGVDRKYWWNECRYY